MRGAVCVCGGGEAAGGLHSHCCTAHTAAQHCRVCDTTACSMHTTHSMHNLHTPITHSTTRCAPPYPKHPHTPFPSPPTPCPLLHHPPVQA